jgi:sec-independent protein translocase protein TatB
MFDFGFSELVVIGVVMLIVVGPERLPKVARTAGHLLGRLQRYVSDVKSDIQREMQLDELKKLQEQVKQQAQALETSVRSQAADVEGELGRAAGELRAMENAVTESSPGVSAAIGAASGLSAAESGAAGAAGASGNPQLELGLASANKQPAPADKA